MKLVTLIDEDFINYKRASMLIATPYCDFKCNMDAGYEVCHNMHLANTDIIELSNVVLVDRYMSNPITNAIVFAGLEPFYFDNPNGTFITYEDGILDFIARIRVDVQCKDDIVFYSGYTEVELEQAGILRLLEIYGNIIVKFGRFIPNSKPRFDEVLGVTLSSDNQYAKYIGPKIDY